MTARPAFPAVSGAATFQDIRKDLAGTIARNAAGAIRTGVLPYAAANLVTGTAGMAVTVADCVFVLDRSGVLLMANDGTATVAITAAPGSGSRWSIIYGKQRETESPFSDSVAGPIIDKVESTTSEAAARALLASTVPGAIELAVVQVNAGATATNGAGVTITQTHQFTATQGSVVWARNATELAAWTPADGNVAWQMDTRVLWVRTSGVWQRVNSGLNLVTAGSFSGVTSVNIDGFSSVFDDFTIEIDVDSISSVANLFAQLRAAGVNETAATYYEELHFAGGTTSAAVNQTAVTSWQLTTQSGNQAKVKIELANPAQLRRTMGLLMAQGWDTTAGSTPMGTTFAGLGTGSTTAYTGLAVYTTGGQTISGRYRVYGHYAG